MNHAARRRGLLLPVAALALALVAPVCALVVAGFLAGWKFQPIETASMAPVHGPGSLAIVEPVDPGLVQPGMVIVFDDPLAPGRLVSHRVVERAPGDAVRWTTKGDANARTDPMPIAASALRGRVRWSIPGAGSVVSAMEGWLGVALLVGVPLGLLALTELRRARPSVRSSGVGSGRRGSRAVH